MFYKAEYPLMQVQSIAECSKGEHSAILSTIIKLPIVIETSALSISDWLFYTCYAVHEIMYCRAHTNIWRVFLYESHLQ